MTEDPQNETNLLSVFSANIRGNLIAKKDTFNYICHSSLYYHADKIAFIWFVLNEFDRMVSNLIYKTFSIAFINETEN